MKKSEFLGEDIIERVAKEREHLGVDKQMLTDIMDSIDEWAKGDGVFTNVDIECINEWNEVKTEHELKQFISNWIFWAESLETMLTSITDYDNEEKQRKQAEIVGNSKLGVDYYYIDESLMITKGGKLWWLGV